MLREANSNEENRFAAFYNEVLITVLHKAEIYKKNTKKKNTKEPKVFQDDDGSQILDFGNTFKFKTFKRVILKSTSDGSTQLEFWFGDLYTQAVPFYMAYEDKPLEMLTEFDQKGFLIVPNIYIKIRVGAKNRIDFCTYEANSAPDYEKFFKYIKEHSNDIFKSLFKNGSAIQENLKKLRDDGIAISDNDRLNRLIDAFGKATMTDTFAQIQFDNKTYKILADAHIVPHIGVEKLYPNDLSNEEIKKKQIVDDVMAVLDSVARLEGGEPVGSKSNQADYSTPMRNVFFDNFDKVKMLLETKKQLILYGPPGTGKTYNARRLAVLFLGGDISTDEKCNESYRNLHEAGRLEFITFHPSYSYEEFVEGITLKTDDGANVQNQTQSKTDRITYELKQGIFKKLCARARNNAEKIVLIIDEINRGDISKIFGELITLLEKDKRLGGEHEIEVELPYSNDKFAVPPNLYIIGTMNTADRSIALLDTALRRRFGFVELMPDFSLLPENQLFNKTIEVLTKINKRIRDDKEIGREKQVGHSFFFGVKNEDDLKMVWYYEILPLLMEYCLDDFEKVNKILFGDKDSSIVFDSEGSLEKFEKFALDKFLEAVKGAR